MKPEQEEAWEEFEWFVRERWRIATRKEAGEPPPWTDDPILRSGKFGNVWREWDAGTKWERELLSSYEDPRDCLRLILVYRHNLMPQTTECLLAGGFASDVLRACDGRPVVNDVVKEWPGFAGKAYADCEPEAWARYVVAHRLEVDEQVPKLWPHFERVVQYGQGDPHALSLLLRRYLLRLGEFKTYEVMTSLAYCDWWPFGAMSLAHVGHGSAETLALLTGRATPDALLEAELELERRLGVATTTRMTEDSLCEWRKFRAVRDGTRDNRPWPDGLRRFEN